MRTRALVLLLAALLAQHGSTSLAAQFDEESVKAAALINVARFVDWPGPDAPGGPFVIAVAGGDGMVTAIVEIVRGRRLHDREVRVQHLDDDRHCGCQVLFVSKDDEGRATALLDFIRSTAVLTVGETPAFLRAGGLVRLYREEDRLRLQISGKSAAQSPLKISSRLMTLSTRVQ